MQNADATQSHIKIAVDNDAPLRLADAIEIAFPRGGITQGNRTWNSAATLAGFCVLSEMDSTGSRMIRGAGEGVGSVYRMLGRFGRPAHRQCGVARLS